MSEPLTSAQQELANQMLAEGKIRLAPGGSPDEAIAAAAVMLFVMRQGGELTFKIRKMKVDDR